MTSPTDSDTRWEILGDVRDRPSHSICRCNCGTYREVETRTIRSGHSRSCGCIPRERGRPGTRPIVHRVRPGDRFGRLVVLDSSNRREISCVCDCGSKRTLPAGSLYSGLTKSCGCLRSDVSRASGRGNTRPTLPLGSRYGMLTVVGGMKREQTKCRCDCGLLRTVSAANLVADKVYSCGCTKRRPKPGPDPSRWKSRHPLYPTWCGMKARCLNPKVKGYRNYGGRGIKIHDPWLDAEVFILEIEQLLGQRPDGMTLDRIDNDGDYEPGNVRWATLAGQSRNRRHVVARDVECPHCHTVFRADKALTFVT